MNQFVNPEQRGVDLPEGCKDLMDVIRHPWLIRSAGPIEGGKFSAPDYGAGTFEHIEFHVSRLFMSTAQVRLLNILCCEGNERKVVVSLMFRDGALGLTLLLGAEEISCESAIRVLFAKSGALPTIDTVASTGASSSRFLKFPLPTSAPRAALLTADLLLKGFKLAESSKLFFYYHVVLRG